MDPADFPSSVRELRARGLSPKEIARTLGVRRAAVEPLIRADAQAVTVDAGTTRRRRRPSRVETDPGSRRQLTARGPILLWRDGAEGRREGLVCLVSACSNPACACRDVWIDGMLIDDRAIAVSGGERSLRISWLAGNAPPSTGHWPLRATVDIDRHTVTSRGEGVRADLVEWLRGELDEDLLTLLRERFRLAKR